MKKSIEFSGRTIEYTLQVSARTRRFRLAVLPDGSVRLTMPRRGTQKFAEQFVRQQAEWVVQQLEHFAKTKQQRIPLPIAGSYDTQRKQVLKWIKNRVQQINQEYGFSYNRVSVRNQTSRWGSCSSARNFSFNYRLMFLPPRLADYVIVHELCHLEELNHSRAFWQLVSRVFPDHREIRREFRKYTLNKN